MMTDEPVDLDEHRGMAAQMATEKRRERHHQFEVSQTILTFRQDELGRLLVAAPAQTWPEAAAKVRYLIQQFADTPEGHEPRHKALIALALDDLTRLCDPLGQALRRHEQRAGDKRRTHHKKNKP